MPIRPQRDAPISRIVIKIALLVLLCQFSWAQSVANAPASSDLRLFARIVNHYVELTDVEVSLTNASTHDFSVVVGIVTNKEHPAAGLDFSLTDRSGEVHRIPYMGVGFVAGRIDPLVIDLGAHQTYVFYVPAEQLCCLQSTVKLTRCSQKEHRSRFVSIPINRRRMAIRAA